MLLVDTKAVSNPSAALLGVKTPISCVLMFRSNIVSITGNVFVFHFSEAFVYLSMAIISFCLEIVILEAQL